MDVRRMDRDALAERLRELLEPRGEVLEAYLFGSAALGRAREHSDIDIALYVDASAEHAREGPFGYRAQLTTALMAGLGTDAIDVVRLDRAPPLLYHRVLRDGIRILSRDLRATTVREGRALSRYCDFVPQLEKLEGGRRKTSEAPHP